MNNTVVYKVLVILVCLISLCACTTIQIPPSTATNKANIKPIKNELHYAWWRVSVELVWPEQQKVAWYMDALLAHAVFLPLIEQYEDEMRFWRFHRRAARDSAGHRFTFYFYSNAEMAQLLYADLQAGSWISELTAMNKVKNIHTDKLIENKNVLIQDNTDKKWSVPIQKSWPYFSMGVSQTWLRLIDEHAQLLAEQSELYNLQDVIEFYAEVEAKVRSDWTMQGGHAYLHHLNALFGYEDIFVYERRLTRF